MLEFQKIYPGFEIIRASKVTILSYELQNDDLLQTSLQRIGPPVLK